MPEDQLSRKRRHVILKPPPREEEAETNRGVRRRLGRPSLDDGLFELVLVMSLNKRLRPWPAALEIAGHLTTNDSYSKSVAKRLTGRLRQIKKRYESKTVQDLSDDLAFFVLIIALDREWPGTLILAAQPLFPLEEAKGGRSKGGTSLDEALRRWRLYETFPN
jgi:hypothetical protein